MSCLSLKCNNLCKNISRCDFNGFLKTNIWNMIYKFATKQITTWQIFIFSCSTSKIKKKINSTNI